MRRPITTLLARVTALTLLAACAGSPDDDPSAGGGAEDGTVDEVVVGVIPIVDVAPIYLGQEEGFFSDRGIELTLESGQGGAAIVPGVVSGQFQFGFSNVTSLLLAGSQELPVTMVTSGNSTTGEVGADFGAVVVPEGSDITDAAGLSGATVAVNTLNNIGDTTIRQVVREADGDPEAIEFVELAFPDMPAAVAEGRVDAAWVVEPFLTIATQQGAEPVAWNFAGTDPDLTVAAYFTSEQLVAEDPELVERFTEAMTESLQYAQDNPEQARAVLGTYTEIDDATTEALTLPRWPAEVDAESVQLLADLAVEDGLIEEAPDLEALLP